MTARPQGTAPPGADLPFLSLRFADVVSATLPDWDVTADGAPDLAGGGGVWVHCAPPSAQPLPEQGWKLHVSAAVVNAVDVLRRVLPVVGRHRVTFKVAAEGARLARLNSGLDGASQVGKFLTFYPPSEDAAVALAADLESATRGFVVPRIPSDRALQTGSAVHYRFGGFSRRHLQTPIGQPVLAVSKPDGTLVPDQRRTTFFAPDWVTDPFIAAGVAAPDARRRRVVDGRFLLLLKLSDTARGSVHSVVDLHEGRRAILKHAAAGAAAGPDGMDAVDRLEVERDLLATLPPTAAAPMLYAAGIWDGGRYVAMEEVPGDQSDAVVSRCRARGQTIPALRIARWAADVAQTLERVHEAGYVYRDLKAANVIVTAADRSTTEAAYSGTRGAPAPAVDRARLIDFEFAKPIGAPPVVGDGGTRGHRPAERDFTPAAPADDIYGFGALLWGWVCHIETSFNPHDTDLNRLDPYLVKPDLNPDLLALANRCLRPVADRPRDAATVVRAIRSVVAALEGRPAANASQPRRTLVRSDVNWLGLADQAGEKLLAAGVAVDGHLVFPARRREVTGVASRTIYEGNAGAVLALTQLVAAGFDRYTDALRRAAAWLCAPGTADVAELSGLYAGEMGVAVALAGAGKVLLDDELLSAARLCSEKVSSAPYQGPDIISGAAGRVRGHLHLAALVGDEAEAKRATAAGRWLVEAAQPQAPGGVAWQLPAGLFRLGGQFCYGYGHGAAGVADVLLDLAETTGEEMFAETARSGMAWVLTGAVNCGEDGDALDWPEYQGTEPFGAYWCHGAGGIAPVLARAGHLPQATAAARLLSRMRHCGTVRCHGLAGNIEMLLTLHARLGAADLHAAALDQAHLLAAWRTDDRGWPGEFPDDHSPDYMAGTAGLIPTFLRLGGASAGDALMS